MLYLAGAQGLYANTCHLNVSIPHGSNNRGRVSSYMVAVHAAGLVDLQVEVQLDGNALDMAYIVGFALVVAMLEDTDLVKEVAQCGVSSF